MYRHSQSFPTRRSSDLSVGGVRDISPEGFDRRRLRDEVEPLPKSTDRPSHLLLPRPEVAVAQPPANGRLSSCFVERARPSDRKSTRLNSSHLVISYAVF